MSRGLWDRETVAELLIAATLPVLAIWLAATGFDGLGRLVFFLICAGAWHVIFMLARAQPPSLAGIVTALALAILAPQDLGLTALILSTSFGVVTAELAFGGWGRNVLNPATVTLAFMGFGFPTAPWPDIAVQVGWAALFAAAIGCVTGVMSPRLVLGALIPVGMGHWVGLDIGPVFAALAVTLVLMVADPVASAATEAGRWCNGLIYGGLAVLFTAVWTDAAPVRIAVSAALLAALLAPLADEIAISLWVYRRKRRHG